MLGAGGAARAAVWALRARGPRSRSGTAPAPGPRRSTSLRGAGQTIDVEVSGDATTALDQSDYELIVNTTAVGLRGEDPFDELPLAATASAPGRWSSTWSTARPSTLLLAAAAAGAATVDGIEILVQQGALSLEIWTGREAPLEVMRAAAYSLGER